MASASRVPLLAGELHRTAHPSDAPVAAGRGPVDGGVNDLDELAAAARADHQRHQGRGGGKGPPFEKALSDP